MKRITILTLVACVVVLVAGCAGMYRDELAEAYRNGSISAAADYHRLAIQRDAQRQAYFVQLQNSQQQYQRDSQDIMNQAIAADHQRDADMAEQMTRSSIATQSLIGQRQRTVFPNTTSQNSVFDRNLPTALDQPTRTDLQTGKFKIGTDGRMWHEYTTVSGYTYWKVD